MSKIDYTDCNCDDFSSSNYERYYMLSEMINEPVDKYLPKRTSQSQSHDMK